MSFHLARSVIRVSFKQEVHMAIIITRTDHSAKGLRKFAAQSKDSNASRRVLAIAMLLEGSSRKFATECCGMDRQTLCDWVHRYNLEGITGLSNRIGGGSKALLNEEQLGQLASWVEAGPDPKSDGVVRWRRADLATRIKKEFGITVHERTVGDYLARLGFVRMTVRPEHPKTNQEAQEDFKKLHTNC